MSTISQIQQLNHNVPEQDAVCIRHPKILPKNTGRIFWMQGSPSKEWNRLDADMAYQASLGIEDIAGIPQPWATVAEAYPEIYEAAQLKSQRFLGKIAIKGETGVSPAAETQNKENLAGDMWLAAQGNLQKRKTTEINVATEV